MLDIKFCISMLLCVMEINEIRTYTIKSGPLLSKRPDWLLVCRRNDPNLNPCLNDLFKNLFPELEKGIPEINVDPFEPLYLDRVSVSKGNGPVTLAGSLFNLTVVGASNATPTYTEFDIKNKKYNFGIDIPLLDIRSQYNLKGKVLILPLVGHGASEMKIHGIHTKITTDISFPLQDGREIVRIEKMKVRFTVGGMKVKFHNLFNGNKVLGQTVNSFLNQNAVDILGELEDSIGESLAGIFTDLINNVYSKMPTDLWLLTDEEYAKYEREKKGATNSYLHSKSADTKEDMIIVS